MVNKNNNPHNERGLKKVKLRCVMEKTSDGYSAVCLELSLASVGDTPSQCKNRLEEAIVAYVDVLKENEGERFVFRKVPFYWLKRITFDYQLWNHDKKHNNPPRSGSTFIVEQMIPVGI